MNSENVFADGEIFASAVLCVHDDTVSFLRVVLFASGSKSA